METGKRVEHHRFRQSGLSQALAGAATDGRRRGRGRGCAHQRDRRRTGLRPDGARRQHQRGVGVAISLGSNGAAFGVTANASGGRGKGEGKDVTWSNTLVSAGEGLTLVSGGDTTLRGAVASDLPGFLHQRDLESSLVD